MQGDILFAVHNMPEYPIPHPASMRLSGFKCVQVGIVADDHFVEKRCSGRPKCQQHRQHDEDDHDEQGDTTLP